MKFKTRLANTNDAESISAMVNRAYRAEGPDAGWTTESGLLGGSRTNAQAVNALIQTSNSNFLLVLDSLDALLGCILIEKQTDTMCYFGMVTVEPKIQAQGIGKILLSSAEDFARETYRSKKVQMTVITLRHELLAWYERRGYTRTGKKTPFPVHPEFGVLKVSFIELEFLEKEL